VNAGWVVERGEDGLLKVAARTADDAVKINSLLIERRIDVFHLALAQASLEEIFLTLTAEQPSARRAA
jgi:hypothetical protein